MQFLIHLALYSIYLLAFIWLIKRWSFFSIDGVSKKGLAFFFLIKVAAGIMLTLVYTYYYPDPGKADIYRYFNDSKVISALLFENPGAWLRIISGLGINNPEIFRHLIPTLYFSHAPSDPATNNALIIRVISVLNYFSYYNIYTDTLFLNFFSFLGITALFRAIKKYFEPFYEVLFIPLYLLPSVVFWGSGMLKEQLVFAVLGVFLSLAIQSGESIKYGRWILMTVLFCIIYSIKPFVAVALLPGLIFLPFVYIKPARKIIFFLIGGLILVVGVFILKPEFGQLSCERLIDKRNEFVMLAIEENAGSVTDGEIYQADCPTLITLIPGALFQSVFGPFLWQKGNLFQVLAALENALLIIILLFLLIRYFKIPEKERGMPVFFFFSFAFLNYLVIGLTVPLTGAMVHYRIVATPFLFIGILLLVDLRRLRERLKPVKNAA